VSLLPPDLFAADLESGALQVLIEEPKVFKVEYSAAYLPSIDLTILPEVAALARQESWFLGLTQARARNFGTEPVTSPQRGV
jgi:hypothetical protein